jgi:hypothetical protein
MAPLFHLRILVVSIFIESYFICHTSIDQMLLRIVFLVPYESLSPRLPKLDACKLFSTRLVCHLLW